MKMTLGQILGSAMARMTRTSSVPERMLIEQINLAGDETIIAMRSAWNEKALTISYMNLVGNQDHYDWPPEVDEVRKMSRLDLGSEAYPVNRREMTRDDIGPSRSLSGAVIDAATPFVFQEGLTYYIMPDNKFRLAEIPKASVVDGLRIVHFPKFVPLAGLDTVPNLPERIHEVLVAKALKRIVGLEGADLVNVRATAQFIVDWEARLIDFLYPSDTERGTEVDEEYGYYEERF